MKKVYVLASSSLRRIELMKLISEDFIQLSPEVNEDIYHNLPPKQKAKNLARDKCEKAKTMIDSDDKIIIACDTVVDFNNTVFEKPKSKQDAFNMLKNLSGNTHFVHTAVCVFMDNGYHSFTSTSKVYFDNIPKKDIINYINTDEPYDKAGSYAIQGDISRFIKKISGNYHNIVGFPVQPIVKFLKILRNSTDNSKK